MLIDNNANCRTKSFILAPYNSINNFFISEEFEENDDNDYFSNIEIKN